MAKSDHDTIRQCFTILRQMRGEPWTDEVAQLYLHGFYTSVPPQLAKLVTLMLLRQLKFRPSVAELWELYHSLDGRPGPEQAWAMYPKTEDASGAVTREMHQAAGAAWDLMMSGDMIAARKAFLEAYETAVRRARADAKPAEWEITLGWDTAGRDRARELLRERRDAWRVNLRSLAARYGVEIEDTDAVPAIAGEAR